jgi:hypothetical protein
VLIPVVIFAGSALIFGGISALAVFASGGNDFAFPVAACATVGGFSCSVAYLGGASRENGLRDYFSWSSTRRPRRADESDLIPGSAIAAEGSGSCPVPGGDLRSDPDAGQ